MIAVLLLVVAIVVVLGAPRIFGPEAGTIVGLSALWVLAIIAVMIATRGEARGWADIGVHRPRARDVLLGLGLGIGLMLLVPLLSLGAGLILPTTGGGIIEATAQPWPIILIAIVTAAVTEEVLFRAYPIEGLKRVTGSLWPGAAVGLVAFTVLHAGGWSPAHVLGVVLPLGLLLALIYVWRRSLLVVIIAHFVTDLPLLVVAIVDQSG